MPITQCHHIYSSVWMAHQRVTDILQHQELAVQICQVLVIGTNFMLSFPFISLVYSFISLILTLGVYVGIYRPLIPD